MTNHSVPAAPGALANIKVLDLSRFIAGPHCGMILGDLGAEVAKVERVKGGDEVRALQPLVEGERLYFQVFNGDKRSLAVDFRDPGAHALLRRLIEQAGALLEKFRKGTMEKMGLGWEEVHAINPRLVMGRVSGFWQNGPRAGEPCFDAITEMNSGLMFLTGDADGPPHVVGTFIVDYSTALYAAIGMLAALQQRQTSGRGPLVDVSSLGTGISLPLTAVPEQASLGRTMSRVGNRDRYSAPAQPFKTRDGHWVYLIVGNDAHLPRLCRIMKRRELPQDPRFATIPARLANIDEIERVVGDYVAQHDADDLVRLIRAVPCAWGATIDEIVEDPLIREEGHLTTVDHPKSGAVAMQASPMRLSERRRRRGVLRRCWASTTQMSFQCGLGLTPTTSPPSKTTA